MIIITWIGHGPAPAGQPLSHASIERAHCGPSASPVKGSRLSPGGCWLLVTPVSCIAATPTPVRSQNQPGNVSVGTLRCDVAAGTSFVFGSTREVTCVFTPTRGSTERYTGEIKRFGVDIGFTSSAVMLWGVLASNQSIDPGALAGTYAGVSAAATAGVGGAANLLVGGSNRGIALQPLSIEGNRGLNIALGVSRLTLHGRRDARVACEQYHQVERGHGEFSRTFRLPLGIDGERITADLKDGVLTVLVPKAAGSGPRKVDVG